jgi:hypothetical protein
MIAKDNSPLMAMVGKDGQFLELRTPSRVRRSHSYFHD